MQKRQLLIFLGSLIAVLSLTLLFRGTVQTQANSPMLVSAAASLQDALETIESQFQQTDGISTRYNFGASGALQQQIEQGAPVDVFVSAAAKPMNALEEKGLLLPETRRNMLSNRLVLIVPSNSTLNLTDFRQLTQANVTKIAMGEPRSVPVGQYSEEVFANLGILEQVRSKFVYGNNVKNVLAAVESGNADAGIVYSTDALLSKQVKSVITVPESLHSPILYPIAVLKNSRHPEAARDYIQFLTRDSAKAVFRHYGFGIVAEGA